jgi:hypothetical protein
MHVQRLVLVVEMAIVLEEYTTEEQRSIVPFFVIKKVNKTIFIKKCFLFMLGSVYRLKRFTTGLRNVTNVSPMSKRLKRKCGSG